MSSDDEDLKLAIALSLSEPMIRQSSGKDDPIIISSDEDEAPATLHANPRHEPSLSPSLATNSIANSKEVSTVATTATNAFLSERANLEAARLARLKHMRESNPVSGQQQKPNSKRRLDDPFVSSDEDVEQGPPCKKSRLSESVYSKSHINASSSSKSATSMQSRGQPNASLSRLAGATDEQAEAASENELFWAGELRQTANKHVDKAKDKRPVFRLHDILGNKSELTFIILSSFVTQISWIYTLIPPSVPVLLIAQPDAKGSASVHNVLPNWVKVTPMLRGGRGCMHMKFMLLFYRTGRMRVVVSTANLVDYDWRDIENSVWLQDIPRRPRVISRDPKADDFPAQFENVLVALGAREGLRALRADRPEIPLRAVSDLRCNWDFSKVRGQLVSSLAGRHEGWSSILRVGHARLMMAVRLIGARADPIESSTKKGKGNSLCDGERKLEIECQTSSIGTYSAAWIDEFLCSVRGASPESWLDEVKTKRVKALDARISQFGWRGWSSNLKILFPSLQTVKMSRLGEDGAGTMFCQRRQWTGSKFPRQLFHDSNSKRGPVLMHSKMILAIFQDSSSNLPSSSKSKSDAKAKSLDPDSSATESSSDSEAEQVDPERDSTVVGWLYVGSHNFTPSAWGTLSGTSFTPVMNITNFELGIVLPLKDLKQAEDFTCWDRPPRKYNLGKDEPWREGLVKQQCNPASFVLLLVQGFAQPMEAHVARSPRGGQRDDACSFWYTLIRYFSPMKPAQTPPAPSSPSNVRPPPRRLRKRRRPSRPPLPILCDVISVEHQQLVSRDNSWVAARYVIEDHALELEFGGECQQEEDECDLLLCCHLNQFVPHTLETIEEVDGEHAYGQGSSSSRNAALERQLGSGSLRLGEADEAVFEAHGFRLPVGLPQKNTMYSFPVPPMEGL